MEWISYNLDILNSKMLLFVLSSFDWDVFVYYLWYIFQQSATRAKLPCMWAHKWNYLNFSWNLHLYFAANLKSEI